MESILNHENTISETLECPICQEILSSACETSCGHSFCEHCINYWLEKKITCPVCNKNPSPVHPSWTLRKIVEVYREMGNYDQPYSQVSDEDSKQRGNDAYSKNQYAEAIAHYNAAIKAHPDNFTLYSNRSQCYIKLKQYRRANEDCDQVLMLEPNHTKSYLRKAKCLEALGNLHDSLAALTRAQQLDKEGEWAHEIEPLSQRIRAMVQVAASFDSPLNTNHEILGPNAPVPAQQQRPPVQQPQQQGVPPGYPPNPLPHPPQQQQQQQQQYMPQQPQASGYPYQQHQQNRQSGYSTYQYPGQQQQQRAGTNQRRNNGENCIIS